MARYIFEALNDGRLNMKQLDEAVTRTLALKARSAVSEGLTKWTPWDILYRVKESLSCLTGVEYMNDKELIGKVHSSVYHQCQARGYAAPVDVLMDVGALSKQNYENWRFGRVPYLEKVCTVNLKKLSFIMHQIRVYAGKSGYKPSFCYYKQWGVKKKSGQGRKPVISLRFSKSGDEGIERWYATHYIDSERIKQLKAGSVGEE